LKIKNATQLTAKKFKQMTRVKRKTFELMVDVVKVDAQKKKKPGRSRKLTIEDQV
jgi:predicted transcriptional regulator